MAALSLVKGHGTENDFLLVADPDGTLALDAATVNLKCDPEHAVELREGYADVQPGYHMNKRHWNTVGLQGDVPAAEVRAMASASYGLVRATLTKTARATLPEWSL